MFTTLSRWAEPPSFPGDEEKTQNASLCNQAILLSLLFSVVMIATGLLGQNVASRTLAIGGLWVVVLLVMWRMSHSVYQPLVAPALAGLFFAFLTAVNISQGSIRTPSASFYVFWVIMVGLLYKKKGIVLATVFSSLAVLGLILAENAGLLPLLNYSVGVTQWAAYTFLFAITSSAVLHTQKIILQSLSRAEIEIEQRKHIEKSLRLSEYRLRLVSDNAKDVIDDQGATTDEDNVIVMATISYKLAANVENAELKDVSGAASRGYRANTRSNPHARISSHQPGLLRPAACRHGGGTPSTKFQRRVGVPVQRRLHRLDRCRLLPHCE